MSFAGQSNMGEAMAKVIAAAMAVVEWNASMGKIVAAPTAGASGILPAVLIVCGEKRGFDDEQICRGLFTAGAIALKNVMGLVCDPVGGLVECPCVKRNAIGAANAVLSCDLALAGITSLIPFDEVVWAMEKVGSQIHTDLKETARGGLAVTPTALKLSGKIR